jgi:hypothetical protein
MSRTIEISEETYEKLKDQLLDDEKIDISSYDDLIGKTLFFRTVTFHLIGKVIKRIGKFFELKEAVWVADSGRFMQAIETGELNEYEEIKTKWYVQLEACSDFGIWKHKIPKGQK